MKQTKTAQVVTESVELELVDPRGKRLQSSQTWSSTRPTRTP